MRIDTLSYSNAQTQGIKRREWLRQHSPQHLKESATLFLSSLDLRQSGTSPDTLVLGAGACTEVPLTELAHASNELTLVDLDMKAMQQARDEIASHSLRRRIRLLERDISGGISSNLNRLIRQQPWDKLVFQGASAIFDAAALCLEQCIIPDPPEIEEIGSEEFGLVISSLVLSQLFSYPLLDILDHVQRIAPQFVGEQERHRHYQDAAQPFRIRVIQAHLHLLHALVDRGGIVVLLGDIRGFVFNVYGTDHDAAHRRVIPLVPLTLPDMIHETFVVIEERQWEWITDLPEKGKLGRGYEVAGYIMR